MSDKDIEELLTKAPKVEDHRSKEEVLKRLQQEVGLQPAAKKRKKQPVWAYSIATAAVAVVVFGSMYLSQQPANDESTSMMDMAQKTMEESYDTDSQSEMENYSTDNRAFTESAAMEFQTAVYEGDLVESIPFTIGLAGDDAESVPVTFLLPREEVLESFGQEPTKLELYERYAPLVDEQAAGFADYHPLKGQLVEQGSILQHLLPEGHNYDMASASMAMYIGTLIDTFADSYTEVDLLNEVREPITFSEAGEPSEPLLLQTHYSYFLDEQPNGYFLTPNFRQSFASVAEALQYMKVEENDVYQSAVVEGVDYTVQDGVVTFTEPLDLEMYDTQQMMWMIEAMLLTAADFDQQIRFDNVMQQEWQGFDFSAPLPQPIGANRLSLDYLQKN